MYTLAHAHFSLSLSFSISFGLRASNITNSSLSPFSCLTLSRSHACTHALTIFLFLSRSLSFSLSVFLFLSFLLSPSFSLSAGGY